jgi:hypothetical protein
VAGTLRDIVYQVRRLIGSGLSNQLSHKDVAAAVNRFYQNDLPRMAHVQDMTWWYQLALSDGEGDYGLDDGIFSVERPVWVYEPGDGQWHKLWVTMDKELFWANYEFDEGDGKRARPEALLIFQRVLHLRPTPDAAYTLKLPCKGKPQALSDPEDTPERRHWDECMAYGAAQKILMDHNKIQEYPNVQVGLDQQLSLLTGEYALQNAGRRVEPSF